MRGLRIVAIGSVVLLASATGFAGDKSQSTFVNPQVLAPSGIPALTGPVGTQWTNGINKGKTKGDDKCKVQVQIGGLTLPNSDGTPGTGDEVICTADANVTASGVLVIQTTAVFRGEIVSGKAKIKVDLFAEGTGCIPSGGGGLGIAQYDGRITCYQPDPAYPDPPTPFASDSSQGIYQTGYGPRPASPMIATQGIYIKP